MVFKKDTKKNEKDLENRINELRQQLKDTELALREVRSFSNNNKNNNNADTDTTTDSTTSSSFASPLRTSILQPPSGKKGYLFKWQDRDLGWGGTKWALRFVSLNQGKISYYRNHNDPEPRYQLALRGCAVRDDGLKPNKRYKPRRNSSILRLSLTSSIKSTNSAATATTPPPVEEVGAYFHVFSIYQLDHQNQNEPLDEQEIVPLLRFSTPSLAEKNQWMSLLSEACAYCDTDEFLIEERKLAQEQEKRKQQQILMADVMPQAVKGRLPPLVFAKAASTSTLKRVPSGYLSKKKYQTKAKHLDAEQVDSRSVKGYPASKPMHREAAPSYLSAEADVQNYRGFLNLAVILLVVSNARMLRETWNQHGSFLQYVPEPNKFLGSHDKWHEFPLLTGLALLQVFLIISFGLESMLAQGILSGRLGMALHHINAHSCLALSIFIVWSTIDNPFKGGIVLFHATITWMKLLSYALANEDYRHSIQDRSNMDTHKATLALIKDLDFGAEDIVYPENVTIGNLYYFWLAPTLTYQIAFPRTSHVRFWKVISLLLRFLVACLLLFFLTAQIITPNLRALVKELEKTDGQFTLQILAEYGFRLMIANCYCWLVVFYGYFHVYLNLFAEVLRFGDRVFYKDWWNSSDVSSYWRLWNTPVHYWLVRHVYFPCVRFGMGKTMSMLTVFFLSAVLHEVLISIPFHMIRPWAYLGMMGQVPLVWLTKWLAQKIPGTSLGNIIFWLSFCFIGQPMAILMYTIDYQFGKEQRQEHPEEVSSLAMTCVKRWWEFHKASCEA